MEVKLCPNYSILNNICFRQAWNAQVKAVGFTQVASKSGFRNLATCGKVARRLRKNFKRRRWQNPLQKITRVGTEGIKNF